MKKITQSIAVIALGLPFSMQLSADVKDESGFYIGANYGLLKVKDADEFDDDNDAIQLLLGGNFNKYVGVEASYIDFRDYGSSTAKASTDGVTLALRGTIPLSDVFAIYAKVGQLWWETDFEILGVDGDTDGSEPFFGAGISFSLTENLDLSLEYLRYKVEFEEDEVGVLAAGDLEADLDHANIGIRYNF